MYNYKMVKKILVTWIPKQKLPRYVPPSFKYWTLNKCQHLSLTLAVSSAISFVLSTFFLSYPNIRSCDSKSRSSVDFSMSGRGSSSWSLWCRRTLTCKGKSNFHKLLRSANLQKFLRVIIQCIADKILNK